MTAPHGKQRPDPAKTPAAAAAAPIRHPPTERVEVKSITPPHPRAKAAAAGGRPPNALRTAIEAAPDLSALYELQEFWDLEYPALLRYARSLLVDRPDLPVEDKDLVDHMFIGMARRRGVRVEGQRWEAYLIQSVRHAFLDVCRRDAAQMRTFHRAIDAFRRSSPAECGPKLDHRAAEAVLVYMEASLSRRLGPKAYAVRASMGLAQRLRHAGDQVRRATMTRMRLLWRDAGMTPAEGILSPFLAAAALAADPDFPMQFDSLDEQASIYADIRDFIETARTTGDKGQRTECGFAAMALVMFGVRVEYALEAADLTDLPADDSFRKRLTEKFARRDAGRVRTAKELEKYLPPLPSADDPYAGGEGPSDS